MSAAKRIQKETADYERLFKSDCEGMLAYDLTLEEIKVLFNIAGFDLSNALYNAFNSGFMRGIDYFYQKENSVGTDPARKE